MTTAEHYRKFDFEFMVVSFFQINKNLKDEFSTERFHQYLQNIYGCHQLIWGQLFEKKINIFYVHCVGFSDSESEISSQNILIFFISTLNTFSQNIVLICWWRKNQILIQYTKINSEWSIWFQKNNFYFLSACVIIYLFTINLTQV